jgi:hypothetical protein
MAEESNPQEIENQRPVPPEELTEHQLDKVTRGNGSSLMRLPRAPLAPVSQQQQNGIAVSVSLFR